MFDSVARSAIGSDESPSPKNSTNLPTTPWARSICVRVSTRSVAVVPAGSAPIVRTPDHDRLRQEHRLSEHRRLGFDPADAPPEHAQAVDHRRVRVGAHQRVGERDPVAHRDDLPEVLQVDLMADARARRHHANVVERLLGPAQQRVALAVAPVLELDVGLVGVRRAEQVDLHGMIDDEIDRDERVDDRRVAARRARRRCAWRRGRPPRERR